VAGVSSIGWGWAIALYAGCGLEATLKEKSFEPFGEKVFE
jgi:hypothetical protein